MASPPSHAIGGVAALTDLITTEVPGARAFDQWWPFTERPTSPSARAAMHGGALIRWFVRLITTRPDVVHLQVTNPGIARDVAFMRVAHALRVPIVSHIHSAGFYEGNAPSTLEAHLEQIVRHSTITVVMSESLYGELSKRMHNLPSKIYFLQNPVLPLVESEHGRDHTDDRRVRILCLGELCRRKRQMDLVMLVPHLRGGDAEVELELVGPWGDLTPEDLALIRATPGVEWSGVLTGSSKTAAYDRADIFALFSDNEGQPLSLLEAMSRALPIIATDTGGVRQLLERAPGNHITPCGDIDQFRDRLKDFLSNPSIRREVGQANAKMVAAQFSPSRHLDGLMNVYHAAAEREGPRI